MLLAAIVVATGETWAQGYNYIDANGVLKNTATDNIAASNNVIVLDGSETTLGEADQETWYIAQRTLNYGSSITIKGNTHLILADGAEMTVTADSNPYPFLFDNGSLTIYGQGGETEGSLTATTSVDNDIAIFLAGNSHLTINGGNVTAECKESANAAIFSSSSRSGLTINGGNVTATTNSNNQAIEINDITINGGKVVIAAGGSNGLNATNITINGGQVDASAGSYGINGTNVILGWTKATDYIYASICYVEGGNTTIRTADGKRFVVYKSKDGAEAEAIISSTDGVFGSSIGGMISLHKFCLRPLDGNYVATTSDKVSFSDNYNQTFSISNATTGVTKYYYVYKPSTAESPVTVTLTNNLPYECTMEVSGNDITYDSSTSSFTMPTTNTDVDLAIRFTTSGINYIDANGVVKNTATDDNTANDNVIVLDGSETTLGTADQETWYIATGTLNYGNSITLNGNTHLILADGAAMTVTPANGDAISSSGAGTNFSIYAQSTNPATMGILTATGSTGHNGIVVSGNVTICGGCVTAMGTYEESIDNIAHGIDAGSITISGGQITAGKGPSNDRCWGFKATTIILGWNSATDFINCNHISDATVKTAAGKQFAAYSVVGTTETYSATYGSTDGSETLNGDQVTAIGGKILRPYNITNVDYVDADGTLKNTATDGNDDNKNIIVLTGKETQLGTNTSSKTWYVVNSANLNYSSTLYLYGDVRIILADGAKMSVTGTSGKPAISGGVGLTIYGQSAGTGTLTANGNGDDDNNPGYGISSSSVTINSGVVNADIINRLGTGILTTAMRINGGQVTVSRRGVNYPAINCDDVKIGWNRTTDFIKVTEYSNAVTVADGKVFAAYDNYYNDFIGFASGTITNKDDINSKTLRPVDGAPLHLGDNLSVASAQHGDASIDLTTLETITVSGTTYSIFKPGDAVTLQVAADGFVYVKGFPDGTVFTDVTGATSRQRTFAMPAVPVSLETATLTNITTPNATSNGSAQSPATVVGTDKNAGTDYTLTEGKDFDISSMQKDGTAVSEMVEAGLYALTLTGIGPCFGTVTGVNYAIYVTHENVAYLEWDNTNDILAERYTPSGVKVWQLMGHETVLGTDELDASWEPVETWYIAKGTLAFSKPITILGPTHIILAEGDDKAAMTVTTDAGNAIYSPYSSYNEELYIHAQSVGGPWGSLAVNATAGNGIYILGELTIIGGKLVVNSETDTGINADYGFTMYSGQVEVSGKDGVDGIAASWINIDWANASDYIKASSYGCDVNIADGKYFTFDGIGTLVGFPADCAIPLRGILRNDYINWFEGVSEGIIPSNTKLVPALPIVGGVPYIGFIGSRGNWALPAGIKAFVPTGYVLANKNVTLEDVTDVPDGKYVIFGNEDDDNTNLPATFFLTGKESASGDYTEPCKNFVMADGHTRIKEYVEQVLGTGTAANEAVIFALTTGAYRIINIDGSNTGSQAISSNNIPAAGQMLFIISKWELMQALKKGNGGGNSGTRQRTISIDFGEATGIRTIDSGQLTMDGGAWYTIDGRKLDGAPTRKGIYIRGGKKQVVR